MNVKFCLYHAGEKQTEYLPARFPILIGRSEDVTIRLEDRWVSRRHCEIAIRGGQLVVRDLGSKHGTLVNDQMVDEQVLLPGDTLSVGLSTLVPSYQAAETANA